MTFSEAFSEIRTGKTMRLPFWNPNTKIKVQVPDQNSMNTHPYLAVMSDKGIVPWIPTYPELFSEEWETEAATGQAG